MKCGICKAGMEETAVTYLYRSGNTWYSGTVAAKLEKMIDFYASTTGSEVSIINYEKLVA